MHTPEAGDPARPALFEHHRFVVDSGQAPLRLDKFVFLKLGRVSRAKIQAALEAGFITVNNAPAKSNYKVRPLDIIVISLPQPPRDTEVKAEPIALRIVYEDPHLLVVDKPAGMVVHPAHQNWSGTLANALVWHFGNLPTLPANEGRPGLVHRIDKDTSGLLVVAKDAPTLSALARQFFTHSIERRYTALVWGSPSPMKGTIDVHVGRSPKDRRVTTAFPSGDAGRRAITHYETLESLRYVSLLECRLETGRTHQIRAHMAYVKHPLFNDRTYGGHRILAGTVFSKYRQFVENCFSVMPRQALHAGVLGFIHPVTQEALRFTSQLPADFEALLGKWREYVKHG